MIEQQMKLGQTPIEKIDIDVNSRDDIPATLLGLQKLYQDKSAFDEITGLLQTHMLQNSNHDVGRPGLELWSVLVLGILKQSLNCDFDRLKELADRHESIRAMLGHSELDKSRYSLQRLIDNVNLLTPELLDKINRIVVECGHKLVGKKRRRKCRKQVKEGKNSRNDKNEEPSEMTLRGRCDSFVVETDVHFPTDTSLLWDAMRCLLSEIGPEAVSRNVKGWRQWKKLLNNVKKLFNRIRSSRLAAKHPKRVKKYLACCHRLVARAEESLEGMKEAGTDARIIQDCLDYIVHAKRQMDQVERRLLKGETIPHEEKVFSIFETHTRWVSKGKAGCPVELGVPVCLVQDQHQFVLHHLVMWNEQDVDVAVDIVKTAQEKFPNLRTCSFDRGFHNPKNREQLDELLDHAALPKKGRKSKSDTAREEDPEFKAMRKQHPAVESAINHLEHHGLDRVYAHGADGFDRSVSLSILGANIHRLGQLLRANTIKAQKRKRLAA